VVIRKNILGKEVPNTREIFRNYSLSSVEFTCELLEEAGHAVWGGDVHDRGSLQPQNLRTQWLCLCCHDPELPLCVYPIFTD
jgi:hypothetical protein